MSKSKQVFKHMKHFLLAILCLIFTSSIEAAETLKGIKVEGYGLAVSKHASLEIKKQEAFIAAFIDGVNNILKNVYGGHLESIRSEKGKYILKDEIFSGTKGAINGFEVSSQSIVRNGKLLENIISCNYKDQNIFVKMGKLIFPSVEFVKFPNWKNPPKTISGIGLKKIEWKGLTPEGDWPCVITLSYRHEPDLIKKKN